MKYILTLFLFLCALSSSVLASSFDVSTFAKIPVQHEGRIKPFDSFARAHLKIFSGKETFESDPAILWLAESLFDPAAAVTRAIFRIDNPAVRHELGLQERLRPLYRFDELTLPLGKTLDKLERLNNRDSKDLTQNEKDFLEIHENALLYTQILRGFSLLLPLNIQLPSSLKKEFGAAKNNQPLSYLDLQRLEPEIDRKIKTIIAQKGLDPTIYNDQDRALATLGWQLRTLREASSRNELVRVMPPQWQNENNKEWLSPWALLRDGQGSPQTAQLMQSWEKLALTWHNKDTSAFKETSQNILNATLKLQTDSSLHTRLNLEFYKNLLNPVSLSLVGYIFAFILCLLFFTTDKFLFVKLSYLTLISSSIVHGLAIALRCYLLERPPVGTLYESIIFVALCVALLGVFYHRRHKDGLALLAGSLGAGSLSLLALAFEGRGDDLTLLTAVLNTRFWLATHVICITLGYGWSVMTALWAHVLLFLRAVKRPVDDLHFETLHRLALVALLFTSVGTILGGIWADQSWGRFWGWDPKENGALLIVLWIVWLMHGKISRHVQDLSLLAGYAGLTIIVAAAWIGVNLLGVGLHSYGFIDGLFWGLAAFTLLQILIILLLWYKAHQCAKTSS